MPASDPKAGPTYYKERTQMLANLPANGYTLMDVPVPFDGTSEQAEANYRTHNFQSWYDEDYGDTRCMACDCKPWHKAADYPCGTEPERMLIIGNSTMSWEIRNGHIPSDLPTELVEQVKNHLTTW